MKIIHQIQLLMKTSIFTLITALISFSSIVSANTWTPKANFPAVGRVHAFGFSIGNKGYIGGGASGSTTFKDFWEWDQASNIWTQKADLGAGPRYIPSVFSIGTQGYACGGGDAAAQPQKDCWTWDQATNIWTQKKDMGGGKSYGSVGFAIGTKGYVGTGAGTYTNNRQDFWEYDPATNNWTQKINFVGIARDAAVGFSIGNKGYIGTGRDAWLAGHALKDFWEWDPANNTWTQKADFGGAERYFAVGFGFSGKNKGYIGTGADKNGSPLKDFWEWNQATNTWTQKQDYAGGPVRDAVGFSIGTKGYIGTGSASSTKANPKNDFWEYSDTVCTAAGVISSDPSTTVCVGDPVYINASGGNTYSWNIGATTASILVHPVVTTTYSVTVTNSKGCTGIATITIPVDPNCSTTGVSSIYSSQGQVAVMPNPFSESAMVMVAGVETSVLHEIKIFDICGKEVKSISFSGEQVLLEREDLKSGIYFYEMTLRNKIIATGKLAIK